MMYFTEDVLKFTLYIKNKSAAGRVQPAGSSQPQGSAAYQGGGGGGESQSPSFLVLESRCRGVFVSLHGLVFVFPKSITT